MVKRAFTSEAFRVSCYGVAPYSWWAKHNINLVRADLGHVPAAHSHRRHRIENAGAARHFRCLATAGAAAIVYRTGNRTAAECILEMADAAEREWMQVADNVGINNLKR